MDDDHHVAVIDINSKKIIKAKGGKKVILNLQWVNNHEFVTIGVKHYMYWTCQGNKLSRRDSRARDTYVSIATDGDIILTGGSKGSLTHWKQNRKVK